MDRRKEIKSVADQEAIKIVEKLADEIWREHYTTIIGEDQVNYMLDKFQSAAAIKEQIDDGAHYYLVYYDAAPVGYLSYYLKGDSLFLSKIYVNSNMRGTGLGRFSVDFIEQQARNKQLASITLTVNKNNSNAISVYNKMGFEVEEAIVMDIGNGFVMDDYLMIKKL